MSDSPNSPDYLLSVVIPIYNEELCAVECVHRVLAVLTQLHCRYEVIFINDGSTDGTLAILSKEKKSNNAIRILNFSRNFGHQMAIMAGIDNAKGDAIVVLDSDLQDPPELIPTLVAKWQEGYDVVHAQRILRHGETAFKKFVASIFYRALSKISEVSIPVDVGDFRIISRRVADAVKQMHERRRYVRGLVCWVGFKQAIVPYEREQRFAGVPKYSIAKLAALAFDGIFNFSTFPMRVATYAGSLCILLAAVGAVIALCTLFSSSFHVHGWIWLAMIILFIGGIQLICLGVMGEYVGYLCTEMKQRPLYLFTEIE